LRRKNITDLALVGVATSFVVTGTVWVAVTMGYGCLVIEDCCADGSDEAHKGALRVLAPVADLCSSTEFIKTLSGSV